MARIKSALFLDFDNIYSGLTAIDPQAAYRLADNPKRWLDALTSQALSSDDHRDFLVLKAYLNPNGWVQDTERGNQNGRLYFSRYRPNIIASGFDVVDCSPLTYAQKNAADIRIVIDILNIIYSDDFYDEFIIASSDADFTPLLQVLRAKNRRTIIVSAGQTAAAYRNIANIYIDRITLVGTLEDDDQWPNGYDEQSQSIGGIKSRVIDEIKHYIDTDGPVLLAELGHYLQGRFREVIDRSNWFGAGTLKRFILSEELFYGMYATQGHYIWNPSLHEAPDIAGPIHSVDLPGPVERVCQITGLPRLRKNAWNSLFEEIEFYARNNTLESNEEFNRNDCTSKIRDNLARENIPVGRNPISRIVNRLLYAGQRLDADAAPSAKNIRDALIRNVLGDSRIRGLRDDEKEAFQNWFCEEDDL